MNTGVVTTKNYGERVPKLMSQLTLAHELGHNFGSEVRITCMNLLIGPQTYFVPSVVEREILAF